MIYIFLKNILIYKNINLIFKKFIKTNNFIFLILKIMTDNLNNDELDRQILFLGLCFSFKTIHFGMDKNT